MTKKNNLDKYEHYLRAVIGVGYPVIYLGDSVKVSNRWESDSTRNPFEGQTGEVIKVESGFQSVFNIDYLIYRIKDGDNPSFQTYLYTLDRISQTPSNQLLEKILRDTNAKWESLMTGK